jgi:hypothetical protein
MQVRITFVAHPLLTALDYQSHLTFGEIPVTLKVWKDLL